MHPDIQSFPNMQYYDGALLCGLEHPPPVINGIPWPRIKGKRSGTEDTGKLTEERNPCHRVLYIHCGGQETNNGSSPSNEMQADAVEYFLDKVHQQYRRPPTVLVLTPYRGQHTPLTRQLAKYDHGQVQVSTVDAAQRQEADLVIISFVRANATGSVGFTDDAKRPNVAITRAKAGVIVVGHLATSLAASTSGFGSLLYELRMQGATYEYQHEQANPPMVMMPAEGGFQQVREGVPGRHDRGATTSKKRGKGQSPPGRHSRYRKGAGK